MIDRYTEESLTKLQKHIASENRSTNLFIESVIIFYKRRHDNFWRNPDPELTPQAQAAARGTECLEFFMDSEALRQLIESTQPGVLSGEYQGAQLPYTVETVNNVPLHQGGTPTGRIIITG